MPLVCRVFFVALLLVSASALGADNSAAIRKVLDDQVAAWNRGDVPSFVNFYTPDCTYIGKTIAHGREEVLANYRKRYSGRAAMGKLNFSELKITPLDPQSAIVVGHFHLDRDSNAGGPADGTFSLVLVERTHRWLILLDHTS